MDADGRHWNDLAYEFIFLNKKLMGENCIFNIIWDLVIKIESRRKV